VKNLTYGGNINAASLLMVRDVGFKLTPGLPFVKVLSNRFTLNTHNLFQGAKSDD